MLKERIKIGEHKVGQPTICGKNFQQERNAEVNITVDPAKTNQLKTIIIMGDQKTRMKPEQETQARSIIGALQWLASICRPDLTFTLSKALSDVNRGGKVAIFHDINKLILEFSKHRPK